ncbi:MAG: hypothetical protein KJO98_02525, partial [Rhodothermia bacterium]|nr:hypothetical protein [Rhodothermia bacterium]
FQLLARRSVVVSHKAFPFSDEGILEWHERMEAILGPPNRLGWEPNHNRFASLSSEEVVDLARRYDAGYVLTKSSWHPEIRGHEFLREQDWVIWKIGD